MAERLGEPIHRRAPPTRLTVHIRQFQAVSVDHTPETPANPTEQADTAVGEPTTPATTKITSQIPTQGKPSTESGRWIEA